LHKLCFLFLFPPSFTLSFFRSLSLSFCCSRSTVHFYFHGIILYFDRAFFMRGFVETVFHQVFGSLGLTEIKCYLFGLYALRYAPISVPINQIGAARELHIPSLFFLRHKKRDLHTFFQGGDLFEKKANLLNVSFLLFISRHLFGCFLVDFLGHCITLRWFHLSN